MTGFRDICSLACSSFGLTSASICTSHLKSATYKGGFWGSMRTERSGHLSGFIDKGGSSAKFFSELHVLMIYLQQWVQGSAERLIWLGV